MAEMTIEQKRAIAMANARLRLQSSAAPPLAAAPSTEQPSSMFGWGGRSGLPEAVNRAATSTPLGREVAGVPDAMASLASSIATSAVGLPVKGLGLLSGGDGSTGQSIMDMARKPTTEAGGKNVAAVGNALQLPGKLFGKYVEAKINPSGSANDFVSNIGELAQSVPDMALAASGLRLRGQAPMVQPLEKARPPLNWIERFGNKVMPTDGAVRRLAKDELRKEVGGPQDAMAVALKARQAQPPIPGYPLTAAEAVSEVPAGAATAARTNQLAHSTVRTGRQENPSTAFENVRLQQEAAIKAAKDARDAVTAPMRESALDAAAPLNHKELVSKINDLIAKPENRPQDIRDILVKFRNELDGETSARAAYAQRKYIDKIRNPKTESEIGINRYAGRQLREVQLLIDDAIKKAGGKGWQEYLDTYTEKSRPLNNIEKNRELTAEAAKRVRDLAESDIDTDVRAGLPSRVDVTTTMANALGRAVGRKTSPKVKVEMTRILSDPKLYADALTHKPKAYRDYSQVRSQASLNALALAMMQDAKRNKDK